MKAASQVNRRRTWHRIMAWVALAAVIGVTVFSALMVQWTEIRSADSDQAEAAFTTALAGMGDTQRYLVEASTGGFEVDRSLESPIPADLSTLHLLTWRSNNQKLTHFSFPMWFVRAKTTRQVNLGTMTSFVAGDWDHLDLRITIADLRRRGPGLIIDHTTADGRRLMMWTE